MRLISLLSQKECPKPLLELLEANAEGGTRPGVFFDVPGRPPCGL
jgi:hypothetical protein